jgi:hypothetical protein
MEAENYFEIVIYYTAQRHIPRNRPPASCVEEISSLKMEAENYFEIFTHLLQCTMPHPNKP